MPKYVALWLNIEIIVDIRDAKYQAIGAHNPPWFDSYAFLSASFSTSQELKLQSLNQRVKIK